MAHVLDLPIAIQTLLYSQAIPAIETKVLMTANAKVQIGINADGSSIFSASYRLIEVDVSNRLSRDEPIRMVTTKPAIPSGKGNSTKGANVRLSFINTDEIFSVTQDGAIIDPDSVRNIVVKIYIKVKTEEYQVYQGRVIGKPEESRGRTIFTIRDAVSDIVDKPVRFENIDPTQETSIDSLGNISINTYEVGTTYKARYYDAYTYLNYRGLPEPAVKNNSQVIGLLNIDFTGPDITTKSIDISKYTITFTNSTSFIFSGPNIPSIGGSTTADFITGYCRILTSYWDVQGDATGTTIEIQVYYTCSGNPITIIKRLIEHSILGTWGYTPTQPSYLPVDWVTLDYLESVYEGFTVYISETNLDPNVYSFESSSKPISAKRMIEYISEHIGCYLTTDNQGRITLTNHFQTNGTLIHVINSDMVQSHRILGNSQKYDIVSIQYGKGLDSYSSQRIFTENAITEYDPALAYVAGDLVRFLGIYYQAIDDNPIGVFVLANWQVFNAQTYQYPYRYYKTAVSDDLIDNLGFKIVPRILKSGSELSAEIIANFAGPIIAGDVVQLQFDEAPKLTTYAEATRVSSIIGGKSVVTFQIIDQPQLLEVWDDGNFQSGYYN